MPKKTDLLIAGILLLAAIATRFHLLGGAAFHGDEWFTIWEARERFFSFFDLEKSLHPTTINPIYYGLTVLSFEIFEFSEWAARMPAALIGVLAPPVFYWLLRDEIGRLGAVLVATFTLLSAWHIDYSQFSRFYTGVFLFGGLSYYLYWRSFKEGHWKYFLGGAALSLIAIGFHFTAVLVSVSVLVFALVVLATRPFVDIWIPEHITAAKVVAWVGIPVGLLALPVLWIVAAKWTSMGQNYGYGPIGVGLQLVKYVGPAMTVGAGFGFIALFTRSPAAAVFCAVAIGVPCVALILGAGVTYVRPDYVFYALPICFFLSAYLCVHMISAPAHSRFLAISIPALIVISMLPETVSYYTAKSSLDYRDIFPFLEREYREDDKIVAFAVGVGLTHYGNSDWEVRTNVPYPYNEFARWPERLAEYECPDTRLWVLVPIRRAPLASPLRKWLFESASLKYRTVAKRFDYSVFGFELYLVPRCSNEIESNIAN